MSRIEAPANSNYAAMVVEVPALISLPGLDNLVGVPVLGHQALTQNTIRTGVLRVVFTAETQLSEEYARENDLHRDAELNKTDEVGYLEKHRRIKAMKLRGHVSNALLMPLQSLVYTGFPVHTLKPGDTFDTLNDHPICNKYVVPVKPGSPRTAKVDKAFSRVDDKLFPKHLDTDNYFRNAHLLREHEDVIVTQKLHGTSFRAGNIPVQRTLSRFERLLKRFGVNIPEWEYDVVYGSRNQILDPKANQANYFDTDIWSLQGRKIADLLPQGYVVYGELVGFTPTGTPIQRDYTYECREGTMELYVYRVAIVNPQGVMADLSWDGVKQFCAARGLKWTPELDRTFPNAVENLILGHLDSRLFSYSDQFTEFPIALSHNKTVDEGFCLRQDGIVPTILKAKAPMFLEHETKQIDKGEADMESAA